MIDKTLKSAVKVLKPQVRTPIEKPCIENLVFRLHTKCTVMLLLTMFFLVCTREYFGDPIQCDKGITEMKRKVVNNFCFFTSTFTYDYGDDRHLIGSEWYHPHRGIGPSSGPSAKNIERIKKGLKPDPGAEDTKRIKYKYYQWVPFVLFFQCICFYIPHSIWKKEEGGRMKALVSSLEYARIAIQEEEVKIKDKVIPTRSALTKKVKVIGKDILLRLQVTRSWSVCLVTLEVLNHLHLLLQIWLTNKFLGGYFLSLGYNWIYMTQNKHVYEKDPLSYIFPKVTKCVFNIYGPSGSIQNIDVICVLSLNQLYEKIYVFLWFWFLMLLVASSLGLIWRVSTFMLYRAPTFTQMMYRRVTLGRLDPKVIAYVISKCWYADWLFLYYLAKNMPGFVFEEVFNQLNEELKKKESEENGDIENDDTLPLPKRKKLNEDQDPIEFI